MLLRRGDKPSAVKLYAFGIAAGIAGVGGVLYSYNFGSVSADRFDAVTALSLIAFAYAGGITPSPAPCSLACSPRRRLSRTPLTSGSG